jgi:hypothetical protein
MKTIIALISAMLITTPALAGPKHHDYYRMQKHHHNKDKWVAPLIGGVVLGAIIADANAKQKEKERFRKFVVVREPQQHCEELTIIVQNRWGDILERRTEYRCTEY